MSNLIAAVIRKLGNSRPITSFIVKQSNDPDVDDQVHYLKSKGKEHIQEFTKKFVEFRRAEWYIDVVNEVTGELIDSEEVHPNPPAKP